MARAVAPTRADLAGGTLDIWPIGLVVAGSVTVNVALSLVVEAEAEPAGRWSCESIDRGVRVAFDDPDDPRLAEAHPLAAACLRAIRPPEPLAVRTFSPLPAGSGLGGSSALCVALLAALGGPEDPAALTDLARDVEGGLLGTPPGFQDAAAAAHGGVAAYWHETGGWRHEDLGDAGWLADSATVFYSGESRFSGTNNWQVFKAAMEGDGDVLAALEEIAQAARDAAEAARSGDVAALGIAVSRESSARTALAPGIVTPVMERQFSLAVEAGAEAAKVCGAGGGGCGLALYRPERRQAVEAALADAGADVLAARLGAAGVSL